MQITDVSFVERIPESLWTVGDASLQKQMHFADKRQTKLVTGPICEKFVENWASWGVECEDLPILLKTFHLKRDYLQLLCWRKLGLKGEVCLATCFEIAQNLENDDVFGKFIEHLF